MPPSTSSSPSASSSLQLRFSQYSPLKILENECLIENKRLIRFPVFYVAVAKLISALIMSRSGKHLPPVVNTWPVLGGLLRFLKGPIIMLCEEYPKLLSVFTLNLFNKNITFLIGSEVSAHFFKASEADLSQHEVYQFNVSTFGPGVVFDVDYTVRQEQIKVLHTLR
ncbi:hypothetical protein ACFX14_035857 [Malus domestica]